MIIPFNVPIPVPRGGVDCSFCGQSPCAGRQPLLADNSCYDCTDGAHPAWWRGERWGSEQVAKALLRVVKDGIHVGKYGNPTVLQAAATIWAIRYENRSLRAALEARDQKILLLARDAANAVLDLGIPLTTKP